MYKLEYSNHVETSMGSKFRDKAYETETSKAEKVSEATINWEFHKINVS